MLWLVLVGAWIVFLLLTLAFFSGASSDERVSPLRRCEECGSRGIGAVLHAPGCSKQAPMRGSFL